MLHSADKKGENCAKKYVTHYCAKKYVTHCFTSKIYNNFVMEIFSSLDLFGKISKIFILVISLPKLHIFGSIFEHCERC